MNYRNGKLGDMGEPYAGGKKIGGQMANGLLFALEDLRDETVRLLVD